MKSKISSQTINLYFDLYRELIPIDMFDPRPNLKGKKPLHKNWQNKEYDFDEIREYAEKGYNLGWRLGEDDLVIDIDPRNNGIEGLENLCRDWKLTQNKLFSKYPTVITGSKGFHIYASIDPTIPINEKVPQYPGIEFKRKGRQVIIPGSFHFECKRYYEFDPFSPFDQSSPPLPNWLTETIYRPSKTNPLQIINSPRLSNDDLELLLEDLPIEDYRSNDDWLPIMMACHHATSGEGIDAFVDWSLGDPTYKGHERIIRQRWSSLSNNKSNSVTYATLFKALSDHNLFIPRAIRTKLDFLEVDFNDEKEENKSIVYIGETTKKEVRDNVGYALVLDLINKTNAQTSSARLQKIIYRISFLDELDQESALQFLSTITKRPLPTLRKICQKIFLKRKSDEVIDKFTDNKEDLDEVDSSIKDFGHQLSYLTLLNYYNGGRDLCYTPEEHFYKYTGTHWVPHSDMEIKSILYKQIKANLVEAPSTIAASNLLHQAFNLIGPLVGQSVDFFRYKTGPLPVINCLNKEIWIQSNGNYKLKKHNPENHITHCLNVRFKPILQAPLFMSTLYDIFERDKYKEDTIRHLLEILAYAIQPLKNIPIWVLFKGSGANGKTVILNILSHILGDAALSTDIESIDPRKNNHAMAEIPGKLAVIDEDYRSKATLPDSMLKKLSENKMLLANPKGKMPYRFRNSAICLISSNHWPVTTDLSHGLKRRAQIFEFNRVFGDHEQDLDRAEKIINQELSGVLRLLLKSLKQLRDRGRFKPSVACINSKNEWLSHSSQIRTFIKACLYTDQSAKTSFEIIWELYINWVLEEGIRKSYTKSGLKKAFNEAGFKIGKLNTKFFVKGIRNE